MVVGVIRHWGGERLFFADNIIQINEAGVENE